MREFHVLNLGAGVQSTMVALLSQMDQGEINFSQVECEGMCGV